MGVCIDTELVDLWCDVSSGGDGGGGRFFRHVTNSVGKDSDRRMKPFAGDGARLATKHILTGTWPIWTNGHALDAS